MAHKYISATHIEKLGHKIQEIRERALLNIICKLDNGILFDNDLARSKDLVLKLLKWFLFEPCTREKEVFGLLKRLFMSEYGGTLVNYLGKCALQKELLQIHSYIDPQYYPDLGDLTKMIEERAIEVVVPPLQSDVPLSYRSGTSSNYVHVESSATPITGLVQKGSSVDAQTGNEYVIELDDQVSNSAPTVMVGSKRNLDNDVWERYKNILPNYFFNWQPLIEPDRHVIQKVENSLMNLTNPPALLHSCEFFSSVLLHDFPAEIFLQRPTIVLGFYNLICCGSTRIVSAILICLRDLTKALCIRIFHMNDVSMRNYKLELLTQQNILTNSPTPSETKVGDTEENNLETTDKFEQPEEVKGLQKSQLPTPKFCFLTIAAVFNYLSTTLSDSNTHRSKSNHLLMNLCLNLLEENSDLLKLTIRMEIWSQLDDNKSLKFFNDLKEMFLKFGELLERFKLESQMSEIKKYRVIYLSLIHICMKMLKTLVPISKTDLVLPKILKTALTNSLLDVTLSRMYFELHCLILDYVKSFSVENIKKYQDIKEICLGMTATVQFKKEYKSLTISEGLKLGLEALPSLEFHEDVDFLKILVDMLSEKLPQVSEDTIKMSNSEKIVLFLLAYNINQIKEEMYRLCHKKVLTNIGPCLEVSNNGVSGSQILFLLSAKVFNEIAAFGMTSENKEIRRYSENILTYILKAKIVVCDTIWDQIVQAMIPSLPILACHANKHSTLGKTILYLVDPDNAKELSLPVNTVLKCNLQFLFSEDVYVRDEGFSRICWLLSAQEQARELLPRVNTLYDTSLATVCIPKRVYDINKTRKTEHFYQPSSLTQVMEILSSSNIEPVIRRSALNQICVMLEDSLLHQIFLDANGLKMVIEIMKTALTENEYKDYPDSVIPIASILKNLCLYHTAVREELSLNSEIIFLILRGLLLYFVEERMKQDATVLLFLLIFKDFVRGNLSQANVSLPKVVLDKLRTPFQCEIHGISSDYMKGSLKDIVIADRWSLSSIQIHWNSEMFGGFDNLTAMENIDYATLNYTFDSILRVNNYELNCIKMSSILYCMKTYLDIIQNATCHENILESINSLSSYVFLYKLSKYFEEKEEPILELPWEQTFSKFLKALPSCEEDAVLLKNVINFLVILAPVYFDSGKYCWFSSILKDSSQCILDLLCLDETTDDDVKLVGQEMLKLVTECVREEHHYLDYLNNVNATGRKSWVHIVQIIADSLKFSDTEHFYNLAYLDSLLSCLVHVTAKLGWSAEKSSTAREVILNMISNFCELLSAFHRGKGPAAILSVMGLSIIRHILLILNHLIAELQTSKIKNWETAFFGDTDTENILFNFIDLWRSRDVVIRAAAVQMFNSLAVSPKMAKEVIDQIKIDNAHICELGFIVLVDHSEASIVRENAAQMLANFAGHCTPLFSEKPLLGSGKVSVLKKSCTLTVLGFLEDYDFYKTLNNILNQLFTLEISDVRKFPQKSPYINGSETSWNSESESSENCKLPTTPGLVKAVINLVHNILILDADNVCRKLHENGLVKMIFRTLCNPAISISNTSELMLYCDILEMNTSVCTLLTKLAIHNSMCLGTILHTKDCLNLLMSLLNSKIYHIHFPQLVYLKNKLWTEIFNLISALVEYSGDSKGNLSPRSLDTITTFSETILDLGNEPFIESICDSISCLTSNGLQNSALTSLICLLRLETYRIQEKLTKDKTLESSSLQCLLDTVRTPKTILMSDTKENATPRTYRSSDTKRSSGRLKKKILEEEYLDEILAPKSSSSLNEVFENIEINFVDNTDMSMMSGAEISKILLYLYDICTLYLNKDPVYAKKKSLVIAALSGLLCVSKQAKNYALKHGLLATVMKQLKDGYGKLSLESVDCLRRVADKKRLSPMLLEIADLIGLLNNFMLHDDKVKEDAATANLADIIHKLWVWFIAQNVHLADVLKMICTYTTGCSLACQSLPLTSPVAGSGPRKSPGSSSLLYSIITLITKQMDQVSKTHDLTILELCFNILHNCCNSLECRVLISKSNLFQSVSRLHPAITKRQKPWESIELLWLDFLQSFTAHPEGQTVVAKTTDLLELIITMTGSSRPNNRLSALLVLRNVAFYQSNKTRLLNSGDFLNVLRSKLSQGTAEEINIIVVIIWALIANSQKTKVILRSAEIDSRLQNTLKQYEHMKYEYLVDSESLNRMRYVLSIMKDGDKIR